jgi:hypothetical protein
MSGSHFTTLEKGFCHTNASNLTPQAGRFFAKHTAQKSVQLAPLFMRSVRRSRGNIVHKEIFRLIILLALLALSACDVNRITAHRSGTINDDYVEDALSGNSTKYTKILESSNQIIELIKAKKYKKIHASFVDESMKAIISEEFIKKAYQDAVLAMGEIVEYKEKQWGFRPNREGDTNYIVSYKIVIHHKGRLDYSFAFIESGDQTKFFGFAIKPRNKARMPNEA